MREMEFTTEQPGAFQEGQVLHVQEFKLPSSYYYMIEHALGMSGNFKNAERLKTFEGKVLGVKKTEMFNIVILGFDE